MVRGVRRPSVSTEARGQMGERRPVRRDAEWKGQGDAERKKWRHRRRQRWEQGRGREREKLLLTCEGTLAPPKSKGAPNLAGNFTFLLLLLLECFKQCLPYLKARPEHHLYKPFSERTQELWLLLSPCLKPPGVTVTLGLLERCNVPL